MTISPCYEVFTNRKVISAGSSQLWRLRWPSFLRHVAFSVIAYLQSQQAETRIFILFALSLNAN